uniref:G_PROTEIN_RECEP_F1_2 domain-containing protein n=1 Tax=Ascaris lumbricoides TaxID=6252 RepID=A0A0M3IIM3_ASCLU
MCFIAIRRHYVISRPLHSIASPPSNIIPLSTIAICALLFNASKWAEFRWFWYSDPSTKRYVLIHEYSQLANNAFYILVREKLLYPICVYFLPLVIISVLNLRILSILNRERVGNESRNLAKEKRSIRLLTSVVVLFFLCHTGGLLIRIYADEQQYSERFILAKDVVNLLFNINSLANPMVGFIVLPTLSYS